MRSTLPLQCRCPQRTRSRDLEKQKTSIRVKIRIVLPQLSVVLDATIIRLPLEELDRSLDVAVVSVQDYLKGALILQAPFNQALQDSGALSLTTDITPMIGRPQRSERKHDQVLVSPAYAPWFRVLQRRVDAVRPCCA